ncbi:MAG: polysaccharide biosynthesis/export family protein, partial [Chitinophagales bacterium]|nr:polysaccharide biosynthesis/export family protein [Chitinophagales bacterium]
MLLPLCSFLSSCSFMYPNKMLKTPKGYDFAQLTDSVPAEFILIPGDRFELLVTANKGYKMVDPLIISESSLLYEMNTEAFVYEIQPNGEIHLPMIGAMKLAGLTESGARDTLQQLFGRYYIEPYVLFNVINRRVIVYRGNMPASVIKLDDKNMTILETIAAAGGIPATG